MITLKNFLINFVRKNSEILLLDAETTEKNKKQALAKGENSYALELLWSGMEWQATDSEEEYFKLHKDVAPCPFINSRVVSIMPYSTDTAPVLALEVDVDWDDYKKQIDKRNEFVKTYFSNNTTNSNNNCGDTDCANHKE